MPSVQHGCCSGQTRREVGTQSQGSRRTRRPSRQQDKTETLAPRTGAAQGGKALTTHHPARRPRPGWRPRIGVLAVLATAFASALGAGPARAASDHTYIVQLPTGVTPAAGEHAVREAGGEITGSLPIINGMAARLDAAEAAALARDPRVETVSRNAGVKPQDYTLSALDTAYPASVKAQQAWETNAGQFTGRGVGIAVIDTGIAGHLPDFKGADGRSRVIASAVTNPGAKTATDTYGHGTHVAGILAGDGTQRGAADALRGRYVGVAPEASLISVKVSDENGVATVLDVIYGLQFVVDHKSDLNIRIVNLSLESTVQQSYKTDPLDAAVESAWFSGIVVVAAAGNHVATEAAANYAPGNDPFAITVGGLDDNGTKGPDDDSLRSGRASAAVRTASPSPMWWPPAPGSSPRSPRPARSPRCARPAWCPASTSAPAAPRWPRPWSPASSR